MNSVQKKEHTKLCKYQSLIPLRFIEIKSKSVSKKTYVPITINGCIYKDIDEIQKKSKYNR